MQKGIRRANLSKELRGELEQKLKQVGTSLFVAQKPRPADIEYRGITYPCQVSNFLEEFDLKTHAFLRGLGVRVSHVTPLYCEDDLVDTRMPVESPEVDSDLYVQANAARAQATTFLEDPGKASSSAIKDSLVLHNRTLSSLDRHWKVVLNFWLAQCGPVGESRLRSQAEQLFRTARQARSVAGCVQGMKRPVNSKLFQFVGASLQSEMNTINSWVVALHASRAPPLPKTPAAGSFYKRIVDLLLHFVRTANGISEETTGCEALVILVKQLESKKNRKLEDLKPFAQFGYLLNQDEKAKILEWTSAMVASASGSKGLVVVVCAASFYPIKTAPSSSAQGKPAAQKRKKPSDEHILRATTKALFKN